MADSHKLASLGLDLFIAAGWLLGRARTHTRTPHGSQLQQLQASLSTAAPVPSSHPQVGGGGIKAHTLTRAPLPP